METIKANISNDPISGLIRQAVMSQCVFKKNREIELIVEITHVDGNGDPLYKQCEQMTGLDATMKEAFETMYFPRKRIHTTEGALIDSNTGMYSNEGDISELEYLSLLTPTQVQAMFPSENSFLGLIWKFIEIRISTMNAIQKYG